MGIVILFLGALMYLSNMFSKLFSKRKIPDVLCLMVIGIILGPILNIIQTADFGKTGQVLTTITLVFILFNGGLDIKTSDLRQSLRSTLSITFASIFFTVGIITLIGTINGLSLISSLILGLILCGIAATVVIPLTNFLKIGKTTKTTLILESALSDVVCLILSLALIDGQKIGMQIDAGRIAGNILASFSFATIIGLISALIWGFLVEKIRRMQNSMFLMTAFVFGVYGITDILGYSGPISALVFGISIANLKEIHHKFFRRLRISDSPINKHEIYFNNEIGFLLRTIFFVYIGICIDFDNVTAIYLGAIITIFLLLQRLFVAKHFSPTKANSYDKTIIATTVQKGLASAVLASLPLQYGLKDGQIIQSTTFSVILFSIILSSILIFLIDRYPRINIGFRKYFAFRLTHINKLHSCLNDKLKTTLEKIKQASIDSDNKDDKDEQ